MSSANNCLLPTAYCQLLTAYFYFCKMGVAYQGGTVRALRQPAGELKGSLRGATAVNTATANDRAGPGIPAEMNTAVPGGTAV
ncbi:MAG: hypothetical protein HND44_24560 [Chloroflexi bacterium]|nr:hypothetical protein [Ardenticatenaceae bacterium]NOG37707.1 hypothetical protein [Chloroflexota bacterium]